MIQDVFLAGSETTLTTLDWALLYMIEYPEIQRKCQLEIEQVVIVRYLQRFAPFNLHCSGSNFNFNNTDLDTFIVQMGHVVGYI